MSLLTSLVSGTSFAQFADFASPAFFKVMAMRKLMTQGRELASAYRDQSAWRAARQQRRDALAASNLPMALVDEVAGIPLTSADSSAESHGETILALYFQQLASTAPTLIDLAPRRFNVDGGRLLWAPGPGHVRWEPGFQSAIGNTYACYYRGGGESDLRAALAPLGLADTADLFIKQFGDGDQRAVRFEVSAFVASFHAIFVRCKERGIELHPNFLPLGLYLAALYSTLETLGGPFDVRAAFSRSGMSGGAA